MSVAIQLGFIPVFLNILMFSVMYVCRVDRWFSDVWLTHGYFVLIVNFFVIQFIYIYTYTYYIYMYSYSWVSIKWSRIRASNHLTVDLINVTQKLSHLDQDSHALSAAKCSALTFLKIDLRLPVSCCKLTMR